MEVDIEKILLSGARTISMYPGLSDCAELISVLGEPEYRTNYGDYYELYWDCLSATFFSNTDILEYLDLVFNTGLSGTYAISAFHGDIVFQENLKLHKLFLYLNHQKISYRVDMSKVDSDYLFICLNNNVKLFYYLPGKTLSKIRINS